MKEKNVLQRTEECNQERNREVGQATMKDGDNNKIFSAGLCDNG